jgi:hypothetical protein
MFQVLLAIGVAAFLPCEAVVSAAPVRTRMHYIAADEVIWDYTPSGKH